MPDINRRRGTVRIGALALESGAALQHVDIAFATYGTLNAERDNVVLICHALTGSADVAGAGDDGTIGWWDGLVGPKRAIDTRRWFVICTNILGGCYGSTGPTSVDPATGRTHGESFPTITIRDIVHAQHLALARLGIERIHAVIGGSMGGFQVLEWALLFPDLVGSIIAIATASQHSPWCIAFNAIAREALALGRASGDDHAGLRLARKVAMMTYRSDVEFSSRFGRARVHDGVDPVDGTFDVERYLERHGEKLAARFDVDTYDTITRAMDLHDIARGRGELCDVLASITQRALCIGISTDVLYPASEQRRLARSIPNGGYREIDSPCGHDAFLIEIDQLSAIIEPFLDANAIKSHHTNHSYSEILS